MRSTKLHNNIAIGSVVKPLWLTGFLSHKFINHTWMHPSLSELTPMVFYTGLTHLGSETSILYIAYTVSIYWMRDFFNHANFLVSFDKSVKLYTT